MFPASYNEWYSTTWTLICSNWISPFVRGESAPLWTLPHSCALASLCSSSTKPSPKGQVWGVKFNLKPDRVRGVGEGAGVTSVHHIAQHQCACLYLSVCAVLSVVCPPVICSSCGPVHVHWGRTGIWLSKPRYDVIRIVHKNNYAKKKSDNILDVGLEVMYPLQPNVAMFFYTFTD